MDKNMTLADAEGDYDDDFAKAEWAAYRRDIAQLGDTPRPSGLPLARRALAAAPREGLDVAAMVDALARIGDWSKPTSVYMGGENGHGTIGPVTAKRIHDTALAALASKADR